MASAPRRGLGQSSITKGCLYLLVGSVALSLFFLMGKAEMRGEITRFAAASGESVWLDFKIWQVFTSPLLEVEFVALIFQGFMLWMFVPALERWWGFRRFAKFVALTSITGILVGTLVIVLLPQVPDGTFITGLDPLIYASIVAYGTLFANQHVQFFGVLPLTGRQLTIGISGFMLLFVLIGQRWGEGAANCSAMFVAWTLTNGNWTPKIWLLKRKQRRIRAHLKLVRDQDDPKRGGSGYLN